MTAFAKSWAGVMIYRRPHHRALEAAYGLISSLSPAMRSYGSFALLMRYSNSSPLCGRCLVTS